jgi:hypothetical protein
VAVPSSGSSILHKKYKEHIASMKEEGKPETGLGDRSLDSLGRGLIGSLPSACLVRKEVTLRSLLFVWVENNSNEVQLFNQSWDRKAFTKSLWIWLFSRLGILESILQAHFN